LRKCLRAKNQSLTSTEICVSRHTSIVLSRVTAFHVTIFIGIARRVKLSHSPDKNMNWLISIGLGAVSLLTLIAGSITGFFSHDSPSIVHPPPLATPLSSNEIMPSSTITSSITGPVEGGERGALASGTPLEAGQAGTFCEAFSAIVPMASDGYAQPYDDFTDNKRVYDPSCLIYVGADPKTFVALSYYYKKDATHVWVDADVTGNNMMEPTLIADADPTTFSLIPDAGIRGDHGYSRQYTKDRYRVYQFGLESIAGADPATFTVNDASTYECPPYDAYDVRHFYLGGEIVSPPSTSVPESDCP
jgi:hypothetical protein